MRWIQCGVEIMKAIDCAQAETVGRKRREGKGKEEERQLTRRLSAAREINCKIWNDLLGEEEAIDNIGRIDGWGAQTLIHEYCGRAN